MIIGISGKTLKEREKLAKILVNEAKNKTEACRVLAFADELKQIVRVLTGHFDFTEEGKKKVLLDFGGVTAGQYLQNFGEHLRGFDEDVFIKALIVNNGEHLKENKLAVISDVRRTNEAVCVKKMGGILIKLKSDKAKDFSDKRNSLHPTEIELEDYEGFDFVIEETDDTGLNKFSTGLITYLYLDKAYDKMPPVMQQKILKLIESKKQ